MCQWGGAGKESLIDWPQHHNEILYTRVLVYSDPIISVLCISFYEGSSRISTTCIRCIGYQARRIIHWFTAGSLPRIIFTVGLQVLQPLLLACWDNQRLDRHFRTHALVALCFVLLHSQEFIPLETTEVRLTGGENSWIVFEVLTFH